MKKIIILVASLSIFGCSSLTGQNYSGGQGVDPNAVYNAIAATLIYNASNNMYNDNNSGFNNSNFGNTGFNNVGFNNTGMHSSIGKTNTVVKMNTNKSGTVDNKFNEKVKENIHTEAVGQNGTSTTRTVFTESNSNTKYSEKSNTSGTISSTSVNFFQ